MAAALAPALLELAPMFLGQLLQGSCTATPSIATNDTISLLNDTDTSAVNFGQ